MMNLFLQNVVEDFLRKKHLVLHFMVNGHCCIVHLKIEKKGIQISKLVLKMENKANTENHSEDNLLK